MRVVIVALFGVCAHAPAAPGGGVVWTDHAGDAMIRRTDPGADGAISPGATLPDLLSAELSGWDPGSPADPFSGSVDPSPQPNVFRIALRFAGLINPPGPVEPGDYDPFRYGPSPVYGFLEIDVDDNEDSGGEFHSVAASRYLANVARFGATPVNGPAERAIIRQGQRDASFPTSPQFERSGADFLMTFCGCWSVTVVSESGDGDGEFEAGEQWVVNGRFFERAQAFGCLGLTSGTPNDGGPSAPGLYDPPIDVRFTHDDIKDETLIEMVSPGTMQGAAELYGGPTQFIDCTFGGGNHFSLIEALVDLILGATLWADGDCATLAGQWGAPTPPNPVDQLDPTNWRVTALFGTAYAVEEQVARYIWTDTGFGERFGDFNADGLSDETDQEMLECEILMLDGGPLDADGQVDGSVAIPSFGSSFSAFDLDYSGSVDPDDEAMLTPCVADLAPPFGVLDFSDVSAFLEGFGEMDEVVDLAEPFGVLDFSDVLAYLVAFGEGCE